MSTAFYERMAQRALELIAKYGKAVPLFRTDFNGAVQTLQPVGVFASPITNYIHPTSNDPVDKRAVFDAAIEILENDRLEHYGNWIVTRVEAVRPADTVLVYRVELRKG